MSVRTFPKSVPVLFLVLGYLRTQGQDSLFHPADYNARKALILKHLTTGAKDTVYPGSYVKLWMHSDKKQVKMQPLIKMDMNRHTAYYESIIVGMTDSQLLLLRKPPLPLMRLKRPFDTIPISSITGFRAFNKDVEMSTTSAVTMPGMSFMPSDLLQFPYMFVMMPVMQSVSQVGSSILNPIHRVRTRKGPRYQLSIEEHQSDQVFYVMDGPQLKEGEYEWEFDRNKRWEKTYARAERILKQRLLTDNTGNKVFSGTLGSMFFPGFARGPEDTKTYVSIPGNAFVFGFTSERYISNGSRIGLEMQFNKPHASTIVYSTSFKGGMGFINSIFSYMKLGLGGMYSTSTRKSLLQKATSLDRDSLDTEQQLKLALLYQKVMMEPRFYFQFGAGTVNTTLMRLKANMTSGTFSTTDYSQKKFALQGGFGVTTRIHKRLLYDMSVKYIYSPNYTPSIGGLKSYSGIKLQFNLGYISGPSFALRKRLLREITERTR